jgi:hypothetical protein
MDCRVLRHLMLKSDGNLACDDSAGYQINITQVSTLPIWDFKSVLTSPIYAHIRRSFAQGQVPWPGVCENCDLFSPAAAPTDSLDTRISLQIEPTLACALKCPSCNRTRETRLRDPDRYDRRQAGPADVHLRIRDRRRRHATMSLRHGRVPAVGDPARTRARRGERRQPLRGRR